MEQRTEKFLIKIDPFANNNKFYKMIPNSDASTFFVVYGRIGCSGCKKLYPIDQWEQVYQQKMQKGYIDQTSICDIAKKEENTLSFQGLEDSVRDILQEFMNRSRQIVKDHYNISEVQVTAAMVKKAEETLQELSGVQEVWEFNDTLVRLFSIIPRRMQKVYTQLARTPEDFAKILEREYNLLKNVSLMTNEKLKTKPCSSLQDLGFTMRECSSSEFKQICQIFDKKNKPQIKRAWKVCNLEEEKNFQKYCTDNHIKQKRLVFHGSRTENWWSILNTSLKLNPLNAVITGKMFGWGLYFATSSQKSLNYTSLSGSAWAKGRDVIGYLGVFNIAYGNPADVYKHEHTFSSLKKSSFKKKFQGCDCLHAHAGISLKNDEIVVYDEHAVSLQYIVELA